MDVKIIESEISLSDLADAIQCMKDVENIKRYRILAEKDKRGLNFTDLLEKLHVLDKNKYNFNKYTEDSVRKKLSAKNPSKDFVDDLYQVLEIQFDRTNMTKEIAAFNWFRSMQNHKGRRRISEKEREECFKCYEKECERVEKKNCGREYPIIYDAMEEEVYIYTDAETGEKIVCDKEMHDSFVEKEMQVKLVKKILIINQYIPELLEEVIKLFEFSDDDKAAMRRARISIDYI